MTLPEQNYTCKTRREIDKREEAPWMLEMQLGQPWQCS